MGAAVGQENILIGIDLGTTNSSVAINIGGSIEIVKKPGGNEYTPSVFGFDKAKNKVVGQRAYEALYSESSDDGVKNFKPEVKRIIGTPAKFFFERAGIEMSAEEISGEILRNLIQDITRKYPKFDTTAAVITIPAAFSILQCEATKRAGNLAGIEHVVLLQEPIAAAVAYGFGNTTNENWLVYDLGGGTFDVALISSKDGVLSVIGHDGDNFLGGKNIDWAIVDQLFTPAINGAFAFENFQRDNQVHQGKFARLKFLAEQAKMELSQYEITIIEIDGVGVDDNGTPIFLSIELSRQQLEKVLSPLIDRTIDLCRNTLSTSGLANSSLTKIVLVGGPTQIPYIRRRLEMDLGIPTDTSVDPLTIVARGACIFAISQKIPQKARPLPTQGSLSSHSLDLNYETLTAETEQTVSGIVSDLKDGRYSVLIQSDIGDFTTDRIPLRNGKFFAPITLVPNASNLFWVYIIDANDQPIQIEPSSFTITHGLSIAGAPLPHSIGVDLSSKSAISQSGKTDTFEKLIEKGTVLPAKKTGNYYTVRTLKRGQNENPLMIRVGEGESAIPDRNAFVCELGIKGRDLPRDLPEGTEVQLTIEINEMRELKVTAYLRLIDLTLNARATYRDELIQIDELEIELDDQIERARSSVSNFSHEQQDKIATDLETASASLKNARTDEDEKRKAVKQIRDLKSSLDQAQKLTELPELTKEFNDGHEFAESLISEVPDAKDRSTYLAQLSEIRLEGDKAIAKMDRILLKGIIERLQELVARAYISNPSNMVEIFRSLISEGDFTDEREAARQIERGNRAIQKNDIEELRSCYRTLNSLVKSKSPRNAISNTSGIRH